MNKPLLLAAALCGLSLDASATTYAYVSSPDDGLISQYRLNEKSGALTLVEKTQAGDQVSPLAIAPGGRTLYAALRSKPYKVISYSIDKATGHLRETSQAPLADSMAYLSTDKSGRFLLGASYGGDLLSVQHINPDHSVLPTPVQIVKTGLHAHSVRTDISNRFVYAGNLGAEHTLEFTFNAKSGELTPIGPGYVTAPDNTGPRHLAFSPNGKFLYVVGEMAGTVTGYAIDPKTGALTQVSVANGIPARLDLKPGVVRDARNNNDADDPTRRIWAADIRISPSGTLLYMSERTSSTVSAFKVDPKSGALTYLDNYPVKETQPRNIAFSPDGHWLMVSGEKSATVGNYAVASKDGSLKRVSEAPSGKGALWIEVLKTH